MALESYRPSHLNFPPYKENELQEIIMSRVKVDLTTAEKLGVAMCCQKVSKKNGDARTALNLYNLASTISEDDELSKMRSASIDRGNLHTPPNSPLKSTMSTPQLLAIRRSQFLPPSSPSIKHVINAIKQVNKISNPYENIVDKATGESTLPLHHKLVLCAAVVLSRAPKKAKAGMTLGQLHGKYAAVCADRALEALGMGELVDICDLLDSRALMRVRPHSEARMRTFVLNLDLEGIRAALADHSLLSSVMAQFCPEQ